MLNVTEIAFDGDMVAPKPFQILRSDGRWVLGGFQSTQTTITQLGPVQPATDKDVQMLPEGDRVSGVLAFWCSVPVYVTRGTLVNPSLTYGVPQGAIPGNIFTVSGDGSFYVNGLLQLPGVDYTQDGDVITTAAQVPVNATLLFVSAVSNSADDPSAADVLVYNGEQYRVLSARHYSGSGYWKALGTRMSSV